MSAASTTTPSIVSSRRQPSYNAPSTDRPQRTTSTSTRPPTTPVTLNRSNSQSQSNARPLSSSQQASLAGVARRDYETTNVARSSSNRRSSSQDRSYGAPPKRTESTRDARRTTARPGSRSRNSSHMSATGNAGPSGPSGTVQTPSGARPLTDAAAHGHAGPSTRKRTEIDAQTGKWSLGKTIGAGSMGKVKLAKNLESGEQVRLTPGSSFSKLRRRNQRC